MTPNLQSKILAAAAITCTTALLTHNAWAGDPQYTIVELGIIDPSDFAVQSQGCSPGGIGVGRSAGTSNQAFSWTADGGLVALPNIGSRPFGVSNGANDSGAIVGVGATTPFGSSPLPLIWEEGVVTQLPLPAGETLGTAWDINDAGIAVGSVAGGTSTAAYYTTSAGTRITTAAADGSTMTNAYGINNSSLIIGTGIDPNNAARNVGLVYDLDNDTMVEVGALPGSNGALAFGVSDAGHVVGSSMMNQGSGTPFIWTADNGIQEIPLPAGTSQGTARAVNSSGWAVGIASNAFAIPFVSDGTTTWALGDLVPKGTDWDLSTNTFSGALGIAEDGTIFGTGVLNGDIRAFAMIPVAPCTGDIGGDGVVDVNDLLALLAAWGGCGSCDEDITGDGSVNVDDLLELLSQWGPCS